MSEVLSNNEILNEPARTAAPQHEEGGGWSLKSYLPAVIPIIGAILMVLLRIQMGGDRFMTDGALMMIALACYLTAATFQMADRSASGEVRVDEADQ